MSEKFNLSIEGLTLEALAKVVLALKGTTAVVSGSGAAVPQAAAPAPTYAAPAPAAGAAAPPVTQAAPAAQVAPASAGALTHDDVMAAFKANLARIKAPGVQAVNAQFGITSPLALKDRPQDWAGYIAVLNDAPAA